MLLALSVLLFGLWPPGELTCKEHPRLPPGASTEPNPSGASDGVLWAAAPLAAPGTGVGQSQGVVINVPAGGSLQGALDSAMSGDTIVLQAGVTYRGDFVLRARPNTDFITIRTDALSSLPPDGVRVTPANAVSMPKLMAQTNGAVIRTEPGAHHYRLLGLELVPPPGVYSYGLLVLGGTETVSSAFPPLSKSTGSTFTEILSPAPSAA